MEVTPLAGDSMGVRSFAVAIEGEGETLIIDPGASLGPRRDGEPPHMEEYRALKEQSGRIQEWGKDADGVVVTHYHFDHYVPSFENWRYNWCSEELAEQLFRDKVVFGKHTSEKINYSQEKRGYYFDQVCDRVSEDVRYADGEQFTFGDFELDFSEPVPHGSQETDLGYVLMVAVEARGETVVYTSDVQGPVLESSCGWILSHEPSLVFVDGPPTYLSENTFPSHAREDARENLVALTEECSLVVDHHLLRDTSYERYLDPVFEAANDNGNSVQTMAEYRGETNNLLEAHRKRLHEKDPVPEGFYSRVESGYYVENPIPPE